MTTKTIEIKIDTTDDAMVGGNGWENCDPRASVQKFISQVRAEIVRYWPGYAITIEETQHANTVDISDEREYGSDVEDDQAAIRDAISDVWSRGEWYVNGR